VRFRETHSWLSEDERVHIVLEHKRYYVTTRFYATGGYLPLGRFDSLREAKIAGQQHVERHSAAVEARQQACKHEHQKHIHGSDYECLSCEAIV